MHKTMRKSAVLKGAVAGIASIAMLMSVSVTANAADTPSYGSAVKPNITSLLGEYYNWWTPKKVVNNTPQGDAFRGKVTDAGKSVLGQNDKTVVAINNKAAADTTKVDGTYTQAERAALDASDGDALRIYKDAFGPIIGQYVAEGVAQGELPKTSDLVFSKSSKDSFAGFVGTGSAKKDFNYPRPYFNKENEGVDRTIGGDTDLNGLSSTLDIKRIPMINIDGQEYGEDYTDYQEPSQSFPSGHTTKTYNRGLGLATLLPELGPELVARAAEGGNNRVVLGVHYPMDVIGDASPPAHPSPLCGLMPRSARTCCCRPMTNLRTTSPHAARPTATATPSPRVRARPAPTTRTDTRTPSPTRCPPNR